MKINTNTPASNFFAVSFIIALFLLFLISNISYQQIRSLKKTEELVNQSFKVQTLLEQLFSSVKDAESGGRGFIITKDSSYLDLYFQTVPKITIHFNEVNRLTVDNKEQQKILALLKPILDNHIVLIDKMLAENNKDKNYAYSKTFKIQMLSGKREMDSLRSKINASILFENNIMKVRQKEHDSKMTTTPFFSLVLLILSLVIFIIGFYKINKDLRGLNSLNRELIKIKDELEIKNKELAFQNQEIEQKANDFIIANKELAFQNNEKEKRADELIIANKELAFQNNEKENRASELIIANKELAFQNNEKEKRADELIIANKELAFQNNEKENRASELIIANKELAFQNNEKEKRAEELIVINNELLSFTYIASHDLQEPLRKIQLFISRILDDSEQLISEKNTDYFKRMQSSANRMQNLINDLLYYSKVTGNEKKSEMVDLNFILKNVLEEFSLVQTIEETNTTIHYENLPMINGTTFQLEQLFTNLITNSIKYSAPDRSPVIEIKSSLINGLSESDNTNEIQKAYQKITITDNGIGFEQQYAEKIFTLFQRLHDRKTYTGTGIGLTICKKIVENHLGFINANSVPGKGTVITVLLPVHLN